MGENPKELYKECEDKPNTTTGHIYPVYSAGTDINNNVLKIIYHTNANHPLTTIQMKGLFLGKCADKWMVYVDDKGIGMCPGGRYFILDVNDTKDGADSVLNSKLFRFLIQYNRASSYVNIKITESFPKLDMSKVWTDNDLYSHFNLSIDEIKLIESET